MLRRLFSNLIPLAFLGLMCVPASAGGKNCTEKDPCTVLHRGHERGRLPIVCVSIPFVKKGYGQVAMFVMRDFNPDDTVAGIQEQLTHALFKDSKITVPVDDFCRGSAKFSGGKWVVLCDEDSMGWITGDSLTYAVRNGRPPEGRRVRIGTSVRN